MPKGKMRRGDAAMTMVEGGVGEIASVKEAA